MGIINIVGQLWFFFLYAIYLTFAFAGLVGAYLAATTREDAFEVAGRQPKWVWVAMLVVSSLVLLLGPSFIFLGVFGMVIICLYWWDVRPQIKAILDGSGNW